MQNKKTNGNTSLFNLKKALVACALLLGISWGVKAQIITTIAGNGSGGYSGDGGAATAASLNEPKGVAVDASANVYIADCFNNRIRKVNTSGIISTIAGNGSAGYSGDGGAATAASLSLPKGVAVDASGNVYFPDQNNNRIRKVNTSGVISTIAGNGSLGYSGDGGAATAASLSGPYGVAVDASGNVYIADCFNNRIRKVNTSGVISTIAGNGYHDSTGRGGYGGDGGAATAASLNYPIGVAVDASGNVYIADYNNKRIRKVNTSGIISTIAGNGSPGYSGDGGAATAASFNYSEGVAVDASGNVYIADSYDNRIRKVTMCATPIIAPIAGANTVNVGATVTLTDSTAGGAWSSSNNSIATVNSSGTVRGVAAGAVTITYTVTNSCGNNYAVKNVTVTGTSSGSASGIISTIAGDGYMDSIGRG
ncbi:MAG: hypothetical protein EBX41_04010, partial [Chitinophagia bacterium]|nr:hypothetical protein [Chitinophagia bacterium]